MVGSSGFGAAEDLAISVEMLAGAAQGWLPGELFRSYRPERTVAFTMRERHMPGFDRAWSAADSAGFTPVLRRTGGRVAAYDPSCLVVDVVEPASLLEDHRDSFRRIATAITGALRSMDVDARVGPVPGEYCPGDFSVGARGVVKLVGVAQRISRGFRLISSVIAVEPAPQLADVLVQVNRELQFDWDPATCGAVMTEQPGLTFHNVEAAIQRVIAPELAASPLVWATVSAAAPAVTQP